MADFWKSLIELGEEKTKVKSSSTGRDLDNLSQEELVALCTDLQTKYSEKCSEFDQLVDESSKIRTEYEAFRKKAESWQQQMKVLREDDRRLIEQLRAAKQDGEDTDAVMTQALQETVTKLKEEIKALQGERDRETRRKNEMELTVKRVQQENEREVSMLKKNYDALKSKIKKAEESYDSEILGLKKRIEDMNSIITKQQQQIIASQQEHHEQQQQKLKTASVATTENAAMNEEGSSMADSSSTNNNNNSNVVNADSTGRVKELIERLNMTEKALATEKKRNHQLQQQQRQNGETRQQEQQQQQQQQQQSTEDQTDDQQQSAIGHAKRQSLTPRRQATDSSFSAEDQQHESDTAKRVSSKNGSLEFDESSIRELALSQPATPQHSRSALMNNNNNSNNNNHHQNNQTDSPSSALKLQNASILNQKQAVKIEELEKENESLKKTNGELSEKLVKIMTSQEDLVKEVNLSAKKRCEAIEVEKQELEITVSELRSQITSLQTKCSSLESFVEEKEGALQTAKRQWQHQRESLEQTAEEERSLRAKAATRYEARLSQLKEQVDEAKKIASDKDQMVSAASDKTKAAVQDVENQRAQLEASLVAQEAKLQELNSRRLATEASLSESIQEIRKRNAMIEEVRQELDRTAQRLEDAESQVMVLQRTLTNREQETLDKNRRLQSLEIENENEKKMNSQLRQKIEDLNQSHATLHFQLEASQNQSVKSRSGRIQSDYEGGDDYNNNNDQEQALSTTTTGENNIHQSPRQNDSSTNNTTKRNHRSPSPENNNNNNNNNANNSDSDRWASATREWLSRLDHERSVAAEAVRVREEQSAKMRQLESRVDELTFKLAASEATVNQLRFELASIDGSSAFIGDDASSSSSSSTTTTRINMPQNSSTSTRATASSVLLSQSSQPWMQHVVPVVQRISTGVLSWNKKALGAALGVLLVLVLVFNFIAASQTAVSTKSNEFEMVQLKYTQCLDHLARCKKS